jgi:hypothetical protein
MGEEQIKKIIDSPPEYDESKEVTMRSWLGDFYSKKNALGYAQCFCMLSHLYGSDYF